jgi:hypothetical protein
MKTESPSRQLQLFPGDLVSWETLTEECQQSVGELLSLLLEQSLQRQLQQTQTTPEEKHQHV